MSLPVIVNWPLSNATAIAASQSGGSNIPMVLTANPVILPNIGRTVVLNSTSNNSSVTFTLVGYDVYGNLQTEANLTGPSSGTPTTSVNFYNKVVSITANNNATFTSVSVGTGFTGQFQYLFSDFQRPYGQHGVSTAVTGNITYSVNASFERPLNMPSGYNEQLITNLTPTLFAFSTGMTGADSSQNAILTGPLGFINVSVTASDTTGALKLVYLQQGI